MPLTAVATSRPSSCADGQLSFRTSSTRPGRATLYLSGELDLTGCSELSKRAGTAMRYAPPELVVDMSRLGFVDVSGLNALLRVRRLGEDRGCRVVLRGASGSVRRLFELAGVGALLLP